MVQAQAPARAETQSNGAGARLITPEDIRAWNAIRQNALSPDGRWFAHVVGPGEGDATLILRSTERNATETKIPVGEGGGSISISGDSKWLGYLVAPPRPPSGRGGRAGRGGGEGRGGEGRGGEGRGGRGAAAQGGDTAQNRTNTFVLMNLATREKKEFPRIRRFEFDNDEEAPTWIVMQGYPATAESEAEEGGAGAGGGRGGRGGRGGGGGGGGGGATDLLLYHMATGEMFNMGRVEQYAFDDSGDWLAYTMDAPDQVGNGVQLRNMNTNVVRSIESDRVIYRHLAWVDSSRALSVMRGRVEGRDTVFSITAFTGFGATGPANTLVFDPQGRADFPQGWKLASERAPRYADDMSAVFFGIREIPPAAGRGQAGRGNAVATGAPGAGGTINQTGRGRGGANDETSLILWHARDPRLQSQQMVQEQQDRNFNYLAQHRFAEDRFVRLADDSLRNITITNGDRFAYGTDNRAYQQEASYSGRNYQDVYRVDLATGERTLIMKKRPSGGMSASPDGSRLLFWGTNGHYWVLDLATGDSVNITKNVPASFVDTEDDHNNLYPRSTPSRGWTTDGSAVLLYDNWDLWKVPVAPGSERAVNLTGNGRKEQIRYQRIYDFEGGGGGGRGGRGGRGGGGGGDGIDLSRPLYVGTYGEWTKKEGLSRIDPDAPGAKPLFFEDARFNITKARDADVYVYTRATFNEYPNWWVFETGFRNGFRITDANPQMSELAWSSGTRLIDYTSDKGDRLQGALYLPANYEPGKKYPLLVTIYEKRSQNLNNFVSPSETRTPDPSLYTNRGYAVLDPDIVYRVNDPGMSAVWCVIPAVKAAIATGIVDAGNIGLWGHSWGGYQTAFLVTQTDIFKAAIAGAALTDMVSMYSSVYWNTGGANQAIFESSQGRFKGNFIDNYDAYIRNSPAFHAHKVKTPLILLHNDKDGAVDFNQGITYFNTLRQLGKDVILLQYAGENHGLSRPANQRDYAVRMAEWFDHHLKGAPAADWIRNGVPRIDMEEHLRSRRDTTRVTTQAAAGGG
jgi:dienelactone hydrolase